MPDWSRRQTLHVLTAGAAAALAGCQVETSSEPTTRDERRVENYATERVRNGDGVALFTAGDELPDDHPGGREYLTTDDDLAHLTFAEVPEARTLREFAAATDFANESVYLFAMDVEACSEVHLRRVRIDDNGPHADFCRDRRPADVACGADEQHTVGVAVRLPVAGDEFSGHGSGMSSSCARPRRPEPFDANVTLANGSGDR